VQPERLVANDRGDRVVVYRSERPAGRGFGARRLAFTERPESTPYSWAVNSRGRWVAGITAGAGFTNGRSPEDDPPRVRAITGRFGGRAGGSELVTADYRNLPMDVAPPVIDRAGRITFVTAVGGSLAADIGSSRRDAIACHRCVQG